MANIKTKHVLRFKNDFDDRGLNTENADGKYRLFEIDGDLVPRRSRRRAMASAPHAHRAGPPRGHPRGFDVGYRGGRR